MFGYIDALELVGSVFGLTADHMIRFFGGLLVTVQIVSISLTAGFLVSLALYSARTSNRLLLSSSAKAFVMIFRGTPLLCQLYLVYYGAGEMRPFLQEIRLWWFFRDAYLCCVFVFALNSAAYQCEIIRGALKSVGRGQAEAAVSLGLGRYRTIRHIIGPQAMLLALRPYGNEIILLIKGSALAATVTVYDLFGDTRMFFSQLLDFRVYVLSAIIYLLLSEIVRRSVLYIERALSAHTIIEEGRARATSATTLPGV